MLRSTNPSPRLLGLLVLLGLGVGACTAVAAEDSAASSVGAAVSIPPTTTTEPPNRAPSVVVVPQTLSAQIGSSAIALVSTFDGDGRVVGLASTTPPPGLTRDHRDGMLTGFTWQPAEPGRWEVELTAIDDDGSASSTTVVFEARHPAQPGLVVGMGDSVASGHGLDLSDYLGRDGCWRDEAAAYPRRVYDALLAAGRLGDAPGFTLAACSGSDLAAIAGEAAVGDRSQLDHAVVSNPGYVTLTVGANDLGFAEPWELIRDAAIDRSVLDPRIERIRVELGAVVDRLVEATDATIAVTTYYDPASANPQGVDGCRTSCFSAVVTTALDELNAAIADVAAPHLASGRVVLVDLRSPFVGHGAPNGLGPDGLREGGWWLLGDLVGSVTEGTHPYCARGDRVDEPWVNSVDCVHPTEEGARRIASLVVEALGPNPRGV